MINGQKVVLSMGGGMESTSTLGLTLYDPRFQALRPDLVLFSNLGNEWKETYAHLEFVKDICKQEGIEYVEIIPEVHRGKKLFGENREYTKLIDYLMDVKAVPGKAPNGKRLCTELFKVETIQDYLKERFEGQDLVVLIGFGSDEKSRIKRGENTVPGWTNRFLLDEADMCRCKSIEYMRSLGWPVPRRSGCTFCLAGETEIITPEGARPIKDLVGKATLLIPRKEMPQVGKFVQVDVRCFGVQRLMKVVLQKDRSIKTVYATPEHRWVTYNTKGVWKFTSTIGLEIGEKIPTCHVLSIKAGANNITPSPIGIAHGFVFGDGDVKTGRNSPASVTLYGKKDSEMLRFFASSRIQTVWMNGGKPCPFISELPRAWKKPPDLKESRSYLLGWLAGYFAADGHMSKSGEAQLYSANEDNLKAAKDVLVLLGLQTLPIIRKMRIGFGVRRPLFVMTIPSRDLPNEFFVLRHHRERAERRLKVPRTRHAWRVKSVERTNRREPVYCAVVPGREMFTLSDGIVTGNCPFAKKMDFQVQAEVYPEDWKLTVALERNNRRFNDPEKPFFMVAANKPVDEWIETKDQKRERICKGCGAQVDMALHVFGDTPLFAKYKAMKAAKEAALEV